MTLSPSERGIQRATVQGYILPYVRMTQNGKWTSPKAQEYLANQTEIAWQMKEQLDPLPEKTPVGLMVTFRRRWLYRGDLDNLVKAVLDALQLAGILPNDAWVTSIKASKVTAWGNQDMTELEINAHGGEGHVVRSLEGAMEVTG